MHRKYTGFTIVELLIVIVVIGILAAITIVAYNGIQAKATLSGKQSDMRALSQKFEAYRIEKGQYPGSPAEALTSADIDSALKDKLVNYDNPDCDSLSKKKYCLRAWMNGPDISTYRVTYWNDVAKQWYEINGSTHEPEYNVNPPGDHDDSYVADCQMTAPNERPPRCSENT